MRRGAKKTNPKTGKKPAGKSSRKTKPLKAAPVRGVGTLAARLAAAPQLHEAKAARARVADWLAHWAD